MKIVFFDVDGTIYHVSQGISIQTKKSILKLKENGFHVAVCTSRSMPFIIDEIKEIGFDGYIASSGAYLMSNNNEKSFCIEKDSLNSIISIITQNGLSPILCGNQNIYCNKVELSQLYDDWIDLAIQQIGTHIVALSDFSYDEPINKICVKVPSDSPVKDNFDSLFNKIKEITSIDINEGRDEHNSLVEFEIVIKGCNKGTGIREYIRAFIDEPIEESWGVGDDYADIKMFEVVSNSIAMGNANDIVKSNAHYITKSFREEGITFACNKYILAKEAYQLIMSFTDISTNGILGYERFLIFDKSKWLDLFIQNKSIPPVQIDWQISSNCNLNCRWCVGKTTNSENQYQILKDSMDLDSVRTVANKIITTEINGLKTDTVQFSGFTGEPLLHWDLLREAIRILKNNGIRVGIFTNGSLLTSEKWETILKVESIHVSIDGGKDSWRRIKRPKNNIDYKIILDNIRGLSSLRSKIDSNTEINTGYTITNDNIMELEQTIIDLISAGADSICIKYDITGSEAISDVQQCEEITRECQNKYNSDRFKVLIMHDHKLDKTENRWKCGMGCFYRYFFCTIGSNGYIYPCDYQTLKECPEFGNISEQSFYDIYRTKDINWEDAVVNDSSFANVCPPFAEVINPYLQKLTKVIEQTGNEAVYFAIEMIRNKFK